MSVKLRNNGADKVYCGEECLPFLFNFCESEE